MGIISKYCLSTFEIINEIYSTIGAGVFGVALLLDHGFDSSNFVRTITILSVTGACLTYVFRETNKTKASKHKVVFISGCDSGLGFSLAQHMADMGFTVIAGFLSLKSKGALSIKEKYGDQILEVNLDLTDIDNMKQVVKYVELFLSTNSLRLHSVINNSGVMVFGEFEWLTQNLINQQININLVGTLLLSNLFCPLLRNDRGRLINITSHCAEACLPGLAVYGATKAALAAWSDGLRVEMSKYGVKVITFIPGSFTTQSSIMANQMKYAYEMHDSFNKEQRIFYGDYFKSYHTYLSFIHAPSTPKKIDDNKLYEKFEDALLSYSPQAMYKNEPFRYSVYHFLFKYTPYFLRDYFVVKFMQMPKFSRSRVEVVA